MKRLQKNDIFVSLPTIGRNTLPVVATSGFWCSPEHPLLGDAHGIVSAPCSSYQNGQQMRYILMAFFAFNSGSHWGNKKQILGGPAHSFTQFILRETVLVLAGNLSPNPLKIGQSKPNFWKQSNTMRIAAPQLVNFTCKIGESWEIVPKFCNCQCTSSWIVHALIITNYLFLPCARCSGVIIE